MDEIFQELFHQGWELFTRIFMKYDLLEKSPIDLGTGDRLSATQIHLIEAVGKSKGETVTALSHYFMVTKGAVSQTVSQLTKLGYLRKIKRAGNDKEIILRLTEKGQAAFDLHEQYNRYTVQALMQFKEKYSQQEIRTFLSVLNDVDKLLTSLSNEEK